MEDLAVYLKPTYFIDSDSEEVRRLCGNTIQGESDEKARAIKLFYWARDSIRYNPFSPMFKKENYPASAIIKLGEGFCIQKAVVLAALCRAADIPCKLAFADIRSHIISPDLKKIMGTDILAYHGYNILYLDGKWLKATCTFDLEQCRRNGFIPVEFDGTKDAILNPVDANGRPHIEYLRQIGEYDDLPLEEILTGMKNLYGKTNPEAKEFWEMAAEFEK